MTKSEEDRIRYLLNWHGENGTVPFDTPEDEQLVRRYCEGVRARGEDKPDKMRVRLDMGMGRWVAYKPGVIKLGEWHGNTAPIFWDEGDVSHGVGGILIFKREVEVIDAGVIQHGAAQTHYGVRVQYESRDWRSPPRFTKNLLPNADAAREAAMELLYPLPEIFTERAA
jgi:hypothetical protein